MSETKRSTSVRRKDWHRLPALSSPVDERGAWESESEGERPPVVHAAVRMPSGDRLGRTLCGRSAGRWLQWAEEPAAVTCTRCREKMAG